MKWEDQLLYFIPVIFLVAQSILAGLLSKDKDEFLKSLVLGILVTPFAISFFFLTTSIQLFASFALISGLMAFFMLASKEEAYLFTIIFTIINVLIGIFEYMFLLGYL